MSEEDHTPQGNSAYAQLMDELRAGRLNPGDRLRETELAERLGVSRTETGRLAGTVQYKSCVSWKLAQVLGSRGDRVSQNCIDSIASSRRLLLYQPSPPARWAGAYPCQVAHEYRR